MTFLYPLGLLGLIGIPILIIIYIIKTQYTEQTVSSTFLWTLSERFLKRKNPISKIAGIISLILQLLAVTVLSFAIAHPVVTVPDSAEEYCFILDTSASMSMTDADGSRLEKAKERIEDMIGDAVDGSVYTLVTVGDTTSTVYEQINDKKQAKMLLGEVKPSHVTDTVTDASAIAQEYFNANPGVKIYLVTDKEYATSTNVNVVRVGGSEKNLAIADVSYQLTEGKLVIDGSLVAYGADSTVELALYVDGSESPVYTGTYMATAAGSPFQLYASAPYFRSARITLSAADGLALDNEYVIYNTEGESVYNTIIVSDRPYFIKEAFSAIMNSSVTVVSPKEYDGQRGFGLYVFDSYSPEELPRDGAVWFINPIGSVKDAGFSYQSEIALENGGKLSLTESSSSMAKKLRNEIIGDDISISAYVKCGLYKEFTTLYSYQGNPVIFAGTNNHGNRQVVFAMDLHKSDIAITYDYSVIMRNLIEYSFPEIIERSGYVVEDTLEVNVIANCESIRVDTPLGEVTYLDVSRAVSEYRLTEAGSYTVTVTVAGTQRVFNVYAEIADSERDPAASASSITVSGEPGEGGFDGTYDLMTALFIALAVLFLLDWGVYCYEKHQLR